MLPGLLHVNLYEKQTLKTELVVSRANIVIKLTVVCRYDAHTRGGTFPCFSRMFYLIKNKLKNEFSRIPFLNFWLNVSIIRLHKSRIKRVEIKTDKFMYPKAFMGPFLFG